MINSLLSHAAQAIWTAYEEVLENECVVTKTDVKALAAALRVTADQVVPVEHEIIDNCWYEKADLIREQLLAIAAELEAQ